jgi:hypothetical protein
MPDPSTPWGQATPETALRPFLGWLAYGAGSLQPSSTFLDTPRSTPMAYTPVILRSPVDPLGRWDVGEVLEPHGYERRLRRGVEADGRRRRVPHVVADAIHGADAQAFAFHQKRRKP